MANDLISNMSYTSRDFNTIYPELLDLVKKITYKWDPSISNESDPGVILLKLNALIADKCNYNIDKNVLECFPLSVTQEANARQLYEQVGYYMHWYRSATTKVALTWKDFDNYNRSESSFVRIPKFTMITDYDDSLVYTLIGLDTSELNAASNLTLYLDGEPAVFNAIQGVAVWYNINGSTTIQVSDLDQNNRLYFNNSDIAENGIFISNIDQENFASWVRKDNLSVESLGNTFYKFGVLSDSNTCYVEFPDDAATLFRNGIQIIYIRTMGQEGNVPLRRLEKFYNDITADLVQGDDKQAVALNQDNVEIVNLVPGSGGKDKESLSQAYRGYKHTIGTFNTLITLRDYINAILNGPDLVSNVIVTDRNTDIQCAYKIMSSVNNVSTLINEVDKHDSNPALNAYNIKLYALQYASSNIDNIASYNKSFELLNDNELEVVRTYLEDQKAIPHDYGSIRTPEDLIRYQVLLEMPWDWYTNYTSYYMYDDEGVLIPIPEGEHAPEFVPGKYYQSISSFRSHYCIFKNIYPIECRITPIRTLDKVEQAELKDNIKEYLYNKLNSHEVEFGDTITAYELEQIITESDERISSTSIQNVNMKTYATYWNGKQFRTIDLTVSSETEPFLYSYSDDRYKTVKASDNFFYEVGYRNWGVYTFKRMSNATSGYWAMSKIEDNNGESAYVAVDAGSYCNVTEVITTPEIGDWFIIEINPVDRFKDEIYVKSVLQGVSPLFINEDDFNFDIDQVQTYGIVDDVASVECNLDVAITPTHNYYTLRDNESLKFTTSNLLDGTEYSNYVKYYYVSPNQSSSINAGENRLLQENEFVFLFWKETDISTDPYQYEVYSKGNIICPSGFTLTADAQNLTNNALQELASPDNMYNAGTEEYERLVGNTKSYRGLKNTENTFVDGLRNWLSTSKKIQTKYVNSIRIPYSYSYYWVLNNRTVKKNEDGNNSYWYTLFEDYTNIPNYSSSEDYIVGNKVRYEESFYECIENAEHEAFDRNKWAILPYQEYTLDTGEYFFYRNSVGSSLNILGAGTRIKRPDNVLNEWSVEAIDLASINSNSDALNGLWFDQLTSGSVEITEQQYFNIGSGATVLFVYKDIPQKSTYYINSKEDTELTDIQYIKYTFNTLEEAEKSEENNYDNPLPDLSNIDDWRVRTILALSLGDDEEQILSDNQSLQLNYVDATLPPLIVEGSAETEQSYPTVVQSMLKVDTISSSSKILTYDIDEEGNLRYNKIYVYSKLKNVTASNVPRVIYSQEGGATVFFSPIDDITSTNNIDLEFSVPKLNEGSEGYILGIYNPNDSLIGANLVLKLKRGNEQFETQYPIGNTVDSNIAKPGTYYFRLMINTDEVYVLRLSLSNILRSEDTAIVLNKLFRYNKPDNISDEDFERYNNLLINLDPDRRFQYGYEIPENILIENPLAPESFLDPHHIYNSFTICQLDTTGKNNSIVISAR